ncbi:MAG TPA: hypothetical protein VIO58_00255 [Candidatus Methanoperedens sp.]
MGLSKQSILLILFSMTLSGCITTDNDQFSPSDMPGAISYTPQIPLPTATMVVTPYSVAATIQRDESNQEKGKAGNTYENSSIAVEVDYRKYKDWFMNHNTNIRVYSPEEYVCGQYTADMINDSRKAGYRAYFAAVKFSDGTGHALVSFKSTFLGTTSWYFFEPQTNDLMTPETLAWELGQGTGKTVTEVNIYGYFDDAGDKDPASWRFDNLLYNKKYNK